jgi:hypothetical protein
MIILPIWIIWFSTDQLATSVTEALELARISAAQSADGRWTRAEATQLPARPQPRLHIALVTRTEFSAD